MLAPGFLFVSFLASSTGRPWPSGQGPPWVLTGSRLFMPCSRFRSRGRTFRELTTRAGNLLPSPSSCVLSASYADPQPETMQRRSAKQVDSWMRKDTGHTRNNLFLCGDSWNCEFVVLFGPEWPVVVRRWCSDVSLLRILLVVS